MFTNYASLNNNMLYRTNGSDAFVEIVNTPGDGGDDELIASVFEGNVFFGSPDLCTGVNCDKLDSGFEQVAPEVVRVFAGLYGPGQYSPLINAAVTPGPTLDALGRERMGVADVGAIESVVDSSPYPPLTKDDVGPYTSSSPLPPEPLPPSGSLAWLVPITNLILF